ncbi:MAG: transketolase [Pseudomonadales bacterium]|nr:transketolase [Pseudomonadales bacterium]
MITRRTRADALRVLAMDAVQRANSGHPGAPMGMADMAEALWCGPLKHHPEVPSWFDRDRFVLSNGHASMLLYGLLHLSGYEVSTEDLKNFRQLHAPTAGHPEYGELPGVETTTGPLGQGLAMAVGMALAEKVLAARFNRPDFALVDHHTYVFLGDGCLMEGISQEAISLAGTLGLGKLICFYDANGISIDGKVEGWFTEDVPGRFRAAGWEVWEAIDGHDGDAIAAALAAARASDRPALLVCNTQIGFGSPTKAGTASVHGSPLGDEEIAATRGALGWTAAPFEIPEDLRASWDGRAQGAEAYAAWCDLKARYAEAYPEEHAAFEAALGSVPEAVLSALTVFAESAQAEGKALATRQGSKAALDVIGARLPSLFGGSADLSGSNGSRFDGARVLSAENADANYFSWGVREFAMTAACNGMALHGGLLPYSATFLTFMDYARNAVRLAALMGVQNIFVYSHDSLAVGEDGPTHQPVEQLATLRMTPGLETWRPCDTVETAIAWREALARADGPSALILSRQGLPVPSRVSAQVAAIAQGAYALEDDEAPEIVLVATGSEVSLAQAAAAALRAQGRRVRVVSMPCVERFLAAGAEARAALLPPEVPRLIIEAAHPAPWWRIAGGRGQILGVDQFGASGPGEEVLAAYGFTPENVTAEALALLNA